MRPIEDLCCQNKDCADAGKRGAGNLRWHGWSSVKSQIRTVYCRTCKTYFSERKATPLWDCRLPPEKAMAVLSHVAEGCGVRQTARLVHVNRNTVSRLTRAAGEHAKRLHEELVPFSPSDPGTPVRREMGIRLQEGEALRPRQSGGSSLRGQLGPCRL